MIHALSVIFVFALVEAVYRLLLGPRQRKECLTLQAKDDSYRHLTGTCFASGDYFRMTNK